MKPESKIFSTMVGDKQVTMETGRLAGQAGGAVQVRIGDTVVFAAATMGDIRQGIDFSHSLSTMKNAMYAGGRSPRFVLPPEGPPSGRTPSWSTASQTAKSAAVPERPAQ